MIHRFFFPLSMLLLLFSEFNVATQNTSSDCTALPTTVRLEEGDEATDALAFGSCNRLSDPPSSSSDKRASCTSPHSPSFAGTDPSTKLFSADQHRAFERDGFLVVSNLLGPGMLRDVIMAGNDFLSRTNKSDSYFTSIEMGMIFQAGIRVNQTITRAFRNVALESVLPRAAAELMQLESTDSVRVLRDVFMSKSVETDEICDWHVDDIGFWPEAFGSEKEGINAWIALEDMPREFQGSMALSPGSHKAEWRYNAYAAIGLNLTFQGGFSKEEVTQMAQEGAKLLTTCEMNSQDREIREKIEATKWIPDIRKGDVIFATRSLFHRTVPVTFRGKGYYKQQDIQYLNRYSIRFVPGSARLPHGWTFEWSIKANSENSGLTLDSAMEERENLLWYPKVWPTLDPGMHQRLDLLACTELEDMKTETKRDLYELFALFFPPKKEQVHHSN